MLNDARPAKAHVSAGQGQSLEALLAEREMVCADLVEKQLGLAERVQRLTRELAEMKQSLSEGARALEARSSDIVRLSRVVLDLEEANATKEGDLARTADRLRELEAGQAEMEAEQARLVADSARALAEAERRQDALTKESNSRQALQEHEIAYLRARRDALQASLDWHAARAAGFESELTRLRSTSVWKMATRLGLANRTPAFEPASPPIDPMQQQRELLAGSELFDAQWYAERYDEVAASPLDPLTHYLTTGAMHGLNPGPNFDTTGYLLRYPDVRQSGMNPLAHYIEYGMSESRDASPDTAAK